MKRVIVTYGQDTPAYADKAIEVDDSATDEQIIQAAREAADQCDGLLFKPSYDWSGLRIVDAHLENDVQSICNDVVIEPSGEDLGLVAQNVLSGVCMPMALVHEAERQGLRVAPGVRAAMESMQRHRLRTSAHIRALEEVLNEKDPAILAALSPTLEAILRVMDRKRSDAGQDTEAGR